MVRPPAQDPTGDVRRLKKNRVASASSAKDRCLFVRQKPIRRLLVVRNDRIGDLVLTLPAIAALRRALPRCHITALVADYTAPLLVGNPDLDETLIDDPAQSHGELAARLRPLQFDAALVINTNTRNCRAVWRAGIRRRVCWRYKVAGWLFGNQHVRVHRSHPPIHESDFAMAFVTRLGLPAEPCQDLVSLAVDPAAHERVVRRIQAEMGTAGPLFGVHPGNKNSSYNWPLRHYAELVGRLARRGRVMLTGSPAERPLLCSLRDPLPIDLRRRVVCYTDPLPELVAAVAEQDVLIVSSTGPMHLAGVLGTPLVGLFSAHPRKARSSGHHWVSFTRFYRRRS